MNKNATSESAFFNPGVFAAFVLCSLGALLAVFSFASTPSSAPSSFGGADPTVPGNPRYQNFYAPAGSSAETSRGEFNIGSDPITHRIMVINLGPVWRLTPPELLTPSKPECCEALWEDKSAAILNTPASLDPILWTDQKTGRTFASNSTAGANFAYAYTDAAAPFNDGDQWVQAGISPPNGGADHETLGSGPYPASLSNLSNPVNQGEYVLYCSQDVVGSNCQRSDDLGSSYGPGVPATGPGTMTSQGCGGLHGHVHVAPDGTAWIADNSCNNGQGGAFSLDASTTPWTEFSVLNSVTAGRDNSDPSIGLDANSTVYYCYGNSEAGGGEIHAHVAVGKRTGTTVTWLRDTDVGTSHGIVNTVFFEAVGGDAGRAACGFLGTNVSGSFQGTPFAGDWYLFIATTYDEGQTWVTVNATPNDPVQHQAGICLKGTGCGSTTAPRNLLDFNEVTMDDNGRVLFGYSDGCVSSGCIAGTTGNDNTGFMRVARQSGGKPLRAGHDPNPVEPVLPKPPCLAGTRACTSQLSWKAPDNGGSDITGYQILRGMTAGSETVLVANTGNANTIYDDTTADPSVPHYFYLVKAITALGIGPQSNELDVTVAVLAADDVATTQENQPVVISVLANDCGTPPLTLMSVNAPGHGTAIDNGNGTVTYTPANGFFGPDSFTYTIHDGRALTATGTVHIILSPLCALINSNSFSDNFESGAPGWTVDTAVNNLGAASPTWSVTTDPMAHSATHSFFSDAKTLDLKDDRLLAPPQNLSKTSQLTFWHRFNTEAGFDGGVLEVSTDGGATWVDVLAGGGSFVSGGYNGTVSGSFGSPIAGRQAWTGGSQTAATDSMTQVVVNLGAFAGLDVRVRFRLACDPFSAGSAPGQGWWIDDVQFTKTVVEGPCPSVVSRKTHGTVGDFDIPLPLTGNPGIECRTGGARGEHKIIYTLGPGRTLTGGGNATTSQGSAGVSTALGPNANQVTVDLTGITNAQHLTVTLNGVQDATGNILNNLLARMDVLLGDVNASRRTDNGDAIVIRNLSGTIPTVSDLTSVRADVNTSGRVDNGDAIIVRNNSGAVLPP